MAKYNIGVDYNKSLNIMALSPSAWTALAPVQWFNNYKIISVIDNPLADRLNIIDLRNYVEAGEISYRQIKDIFASSRALDRVIEKYKLGDYSYILNRSDGKKLNKPALCNDYGITGRFENKVWFRENFSSQLRFPDFRIINLADLNDANIYDELSGKLSSNLVLQHHELSGSRGTYLVSNSEQFADAVSELTLGSKAGDRIVVSERLTDIKEYTLQACVTGSDVLIGPSQAQLVRHPLLVSSKPGSILFCGGRIANDITSDKQYSEMVRSAKVIGKSLQKEGYRGIYGVDFLVNDEAVYALETNPRMTGLTPLLAFLQTEVPFLLLHILELAGEKYKINASDSGKVSEGSFLQIYAQDDGYVPISTGLYDKDLSRLGDGFDGGSIIPISNGEYFVALRVSPGERIKNGKSLAFVYSNEQLFDDNGNLSADAERLIKNFRKSFVIDDTI